MLLKLGAFLAFTGAIGAAAVPTPATDPVLAVVVHPSAPLSDLTLDNLRRLYLGKTRTFRDGKPVTLLELPSVRKAFYRLALGMTEDQVKRAWIALVFQGEANAPPRVMASAEEVRAWVASHPDAIGFLPVDAVTTGVKVLTIGGKGPRDPGYPLR